MRSEQIDAVVAASATIIGTSHRQAPVKRLVGDIRRGLTELFALPDGWEIVLGNGGTTVFWDVATFGLVEQRSQHLVFGEFSGKFADACAAAPHLAEPVVISTEPGDHPDPLADPTVDVYALTHNETSTGVAMQLQRPAGAMDDQLVIVDATSAAGGLLWDPAEVDVYYFAPQKCFAADGGLWIAACSPAAIERIDRIAASGRWRPASLDLAIARDNSRLDQTYNTPAVTTLVLFASQLSWMLEIGGLAACAKRSQASAEHLYAWAETTEWATPFVTDPAKRSTVVGTIDLGDQIDVAKLNAALRANGIVDTDGYRKLGRNQIRVGMFPAIETSDVVALTACIDHLVDHHGDAMPMSKALVLAVDEAPALTDPVLLVALGGWFDAAGVATSALRLITGESNSVVVGEIDPDPFYDFTVARPTIENVDGERQITWPGNVFRVVRTPGGLRDLVALEGVEPHAAWPTYVDCVVEAIGRLGVELVVTLGAVADTTPHTRPPAVVGSTTDTDLAATFGLAGPTYQGPTGVIGVLHGALETHDVPSVSLRVGVPGYLPEGEHPRSVAALVAHTAHVLGVPLPVDLSESIGMWDDAHNAWVAGNERLRGYVELLEEHYDSRIAEVVDDADIAAHVEDFLRGDSDDNPDEA